MSETPHKKSIKYYQNTGDTNQYQKTPKTTGITNRPRTSWAEEAKEVGGENQISGRWSCDIFNIPRRPRGEEVDGR